MYYLVIVEIYKCDDSSGNGALDGLKALLPFFYEILDKKGDSIMGTFLTVLFYCLWAVPIGVLFGATVGVIAGTVVNLVKDIWNDD